MKLAKDRPVLVTGATGLLGNHLVRQLLEEGCHVRVFVRETSDSRPLAGLDVEIVRGDLRDERSVALACQNAALVFHAAAEVRIGRSRPGAFHDTNVTGTRHVVAAALSEGARLLHVSTTDTLGMGTPETPADEETPYDTQTATPYSESKSAAEKIVGDGIRAGLDAVVVHPSFLLGPGDWKPSSGAMVLAVGRGLAWIAPRGHGSFVDARDVARAILMAAEGGECGRPYLLGGQTLSYLEAWRIFAEVTGRRHPPGELGPFLSAFVGGLGDIVGTISGHEPAFNSTALRAARSMRHYDSTRAERELGFTRRPLRETVEDTWKWFVEQGYTGSFRTGSCHTKSPKPPRGRL